MIPQTFKDTVARKYGYRDWEQMSAMVYNPMKYLEEASLLYCKSKWEEACEQQRNKCSEAYMAIDVYDHSNKFETIDREIQAIKEAPQPEFKP